MYLCISNSCLQCFFTSVPHLEGVAAALVGFLTDDYTSTNINKTNLLLSSTAGDVPFLLLSPLLLAGD